MPTRRFRAAACGTVRLLPGALALALASALPGSAMAQAARPGGDPGFAQHGAHVHGQATLDLAVDGGTVTLALTTPAINVLGFERAPRTDAERRQVADSEALLHSHARLFAFPTTARCMAGTSTVTGPAWASGTADGDAKAGAKAADGHDHAHDHAHDHGHDHGHDQEHAHADYTARWTFNCAVPAQLVFIDVPLVDRLAAGTVVTTNVITDAVQTRRELKSGDIRVRLR